MCLTALTITDTTVCPYDYRHHSLSLRLQTPQSVLTITDTTVCPHNYRHHSLSSRLQTPHLSSHCCGPTWTVNAPCQGVDSDMHPSRFLPSTRPRWHRPDPAQLKLCPFPVDTRSPRNEPTIFCSSLVQSELVRLRALSSSNSKKKNSLGF